MLTFTLAVIVWLSASVQPTARLLLRVFSAQRSLQRPVPYGSWAKLRSLKYVNLPKRCWLLVILWSTRATYSLMSPPVLAPLVKLFRVSEFVGFAISLPSRKAEVGLIYGVVVPG